MPRLDDSAVVRRLGSKRTHVARVGAVSVELFIKPYWAAKLGAEAVCGVTLPYNAVIMATGTKVNCPACKGFSGITEQSPTVHEKLGDPIA